MGTACAKWAASKFYEAHAEYGTLTHITLEQYVDIPTDSKQILADWMREQLGEPVRFIHDSGLITGDDNDYRAGNRTALVRLPECLR